MIRLTVAGIVWSATALAMTGLGGVAGYMAVRAVETSARYDAVVAEATATATAGRGLLAELSEAIEKQRSIAERSQALAKSLADLDRRLAGIAAGFYAPPGERAELLQFLIDIEAAARSLVPDGVSLGVSASDRDRAERAINGLDGVRREIDRVFRTLSPHVNDAARRQITAVHEDWLDVYAPLRQTVDSIRHAARADAVAAADRATAAADAVAARTARAAELATNGQVDADADVVRAGGLVATSILIGVVTWALLMLGVLRPLRRQAARLTARIAGQPVPETRAVWLVRSLLRQGRRRARVHRRALDARGLRWLGRGRPPDHPLEHIVVRWVHLTASRATDPLICSP
jgi:hypothetical protein